MKKIDKWIEKIILFFLQPLCNFMHKEVKNEWVVTGKQFIKFGIVGLSNTGLSYFIYTVVLLLFKQFSILPGVDYFIAQFVGFLISVLWSFWWNNKFVFTEQADEQYSVIKALAKTYLSYAFSGLFLSSLLLYVWVDLCKISEFIAPLINLLVTVPLNFVLNKFWALKK